MSINPYARRDYETMQVWHDRLLGCPLLESEPLTFVAWVSGAQLRDLEASRQVRRIVRDEFRRDREEVVSPAKKESVIDEYF